MVVGGARGVDYEKEREQGEGGRKYGTMNKKKTASEKERARASKGGVTHKKLRVSSGETEWEGLSRRLLNRNDRSSWRGERRTAQGRKGEKQSVKWRRRAQETKAT